jgi:hypothetical protein
MHEREPEEMGFLLHFQCFALASWPGHWTPEQTLYPVKESTIFITWFQLGIEIGTSEVTDAGPSLSSEELVKLGIETGISEMTNVVKDSTLFIAQMVQLGIETKISEMTNAAKDSTRFIT